jgi:hypothetical protein
MEIPMKHEVEEGVVGKSKRKKGFLIFLNLELYLRERNG